MYWLTAIIRPFKLNDVYNRLLEEGIGGMTVSEVKGLGSQRASTEVYRGNEYSNDFIPKIKIEVAVSEEALDNVIDCIVEVSKTDKPGDGKIFVSKIQQAYRIRTDEIDLDAL
ncbi:MAG: P-II family nitrogen regulator [Kangiellaceae bacterium]|nr:P-II family nitrogen regulator [Kangiellaceae bacterium]